MKGLLGTIRIRERHSPLGEGRASRVCDAGLRLRCAWCAAWIRSPAGAPGAPQAAAPPPVSHGLCLDCRERIRDHGAPELRADQL